MFIQSPNNSLLTGEHGETRCHFLVVLVGHFLRFNTDTESGVYYKRRRRKSGLRYNFDFNMI